SLWMRTNSAAFLPARRLEPEIMDASVSSTCCRVFSATSSGISLPGIVAMYSLTARVSVLTLLVFCIRSSFQAARCVFRGQLHVQSAGNPDNLSRDETCAVRAEVDSRRGNLFRPTHPAHRYPLRLVT